MAELSVRLTAKISELESQLKKARKDLLATGEAAENTADDINKIGSKGSKGLNQLKTSTKGVTPTLLEFNRTIQDAPFGLQGVANNIQQLTANFQNLSKNAGGTKNALKALLAGFSGPAGILFAVSAGTALFQAFGDKLLKTASQFEILDKAMAASVGAAQAEIQTLNALVDVATNTNKSTESRGRAIEKINDLYGDYLPKLDQENISTNAVQEAIERLNKSLIRQAKIRGLQSAIEERYKGLAEEIAEVQERASTSAAASLRSQNEQTKTQLTGYQSLLAVLKQQAEEGKNVDAAIVSTTEKIKELSQALTGTSKQAKKEGFISEFIKVETAESKKEIDDFVGVLKNLIEEDLDLAGVFTNVKDPKPKKFKNLFKNLGDVFAIEKPIQDALDSAEGTFKKVEFKFDALGNAIVNPLKNSVSKIKPELTKIESALLDFNDNANQIIQNGLVNTFGGIGQAIGSALIEGGNIADALGKSLLGSFGAILTQLGQLAIETGIGILAVQTALKSLNPYVAIAAGIALVAIGSAFSSGARNIGSGGGGSSRAVSGQGSSSFSSGAAPSNNNFGGGKVVFEIAGTKLIGVLENTQRANVRIGGIGG